MAKIRIFMNDMGLRAFLVEADDLYSFRLTATQRENPFLFADAMRSVPVGFDPIGSLREKEFSTWRYLRNGSSITEIPLPKNLKELGFDDRL